MSIQYVEISCSTSSNSLCSESIFDSETLFSLSHSMLALMKLPVQQFDSFQVQIALTPETFTDMDVNAADDMKENEIKKLLEQPVSTLSL